MKHPGGRESMVFFLRPSSQSSGALLSASPRGHIPGVSTIGLGAIEGSVGGLNKLVAIHASGARRRGEADAHANLDGHTANRKGPLESSNTLPCKVNSAAMASDHQDGKLVAAQSRTHLTLRDRAQPIRCHLENSIPCRLPANCPCISTPTR